MNASGAAAMLLLFDITAEAVDEHDDWHTHEHLPERLAIPGFMRGSRWKRAAPGPAYCVVYEVRELAVLDGADYRARLDQPTPWTTRSMAHYRGMRRTLCDVVAGVGDGLGGCSLVITFAPAGGREAELAQRLLGDVLPGLAQRRGVTAWRLLRSALAAPMTAEQALRGRDGAVHSALWVSGYDAQALAALAAGELGEAALRRCGAAGVESLAFALASTLSCAPAPRAHAVSAAA